MQMVKVSDAAEVVHALRNGRVLCGARATVPAPGGGRCCKRCVAVLERRYEPLPRTPDHWQWDTIARVAQDLNVNWGPLAHPVLLDRAERAEWERLLLASLDGTPGNVRWVRRMSDSALMLEVERKTTPAAR